ncbi:hypothetical protein P3S68_022890 [Capsicum galapagoense]
MLTFSRPRSLLGLQKLVCSVSPLYPIPSYSSSLFGRIEFIGLENMGSRMVDSLIKVGYEVALHDIHSILKYMACAFPRIADHWYPTDLYKRAKVDFVLDWHHSILRRGAAAEAEKVLLTSIESVWLKEKG